MINILMNQKPGLNYLLLANNLYVKKSLNNEAHSTLIIAKMEHV